MDVYLLQLHGHVLAPEMEIGPLSRPGMHMATI